MPHDPKFFRRAGPKSRTLHRRGATGLAQRAGRRPREPWPRCRLSARSLAPSNRSRHIWTMLTATAVHGRVTRTSARTTPVVGSRHTVTYRPQVGSVTGRVSLLGRRWSPAHPVSVSPAKRTITAVPSSDGVLRSLLGKARPPNCRRQGTAAPADARSGRARPNPRPHGGTVATSVRARGLQEGSGQRALERLRARKPVVAAPPA